MNIAVMNSILSANDQIVAENRLFFETRGLLAVNVMGAPGAGKTEIIAATAARLPKDVLIWAIGGDLAGQCDAERLAEAGLSTLQINTGRGCHLDAAMIRQALGGLQPEYGLLFIENVGNLVCPAAFPLGEHLRVVTASVTEGAEKPEKYPGMYGVADAVILNKMDLLPFTGFDMERFRTGVRRLNPDVPVFKLSCRTGEGLDAWVDWLLRPARGLRCNNSLLT